MTPRENGRHVDLLIDWVQQWKSCSVIQVSFIQLYAQYFTNTPILFKKKKPLVLESGFEERIEKFHF